MSDPNEQWSLADGPYRYTLGRRWADGPLLGWVCLNPSKATADTEDATSRRLRGFAEREGFGAYEVVNLDAYRATDPKALRDAEARGADVTGPLNSIEIADLVDRCQLLVLAWGGHGHRRLVRVKRVLKLVVGHTSTADSPGVVCLGYTKAGHPRHPLMVPSAQPFEPFEHRGEIARLSW